MAMSLMPRLTGGLAALLLAPALAFAHTSKTETTPADGATLQSPPATIAMTFDTPVRLTLVRLTDAAGESYPVDYSRGQQVKAFQAAAPELPPGDYTIEWRGLSHDGHPTSGSFSFTID